MLISVILILAKNYILQSSLMGTVEDNCDKQDLVSWYDNNINHPQRSLKQLLGIFILSLI
ncbi:hypothetical protein [Nostoc sp.]|uniref:hypothetical protein n=1 Tax=Nostoc sp. TaxID=1180 RepID=UPI002FF62B01